MEQFLEMAEWQQCTAVLYECAVAADSRYMIYNIGYHIFSAI